MRNEEVSPHIRPSCLKYQDTCIYIKYKIINHKNVHIIEYSIYVISNCDLAFFPDAWVGGHTFLSTQFLPDYEKNMTPYPCIRKEDLCIHTELGYFAINMWNSRNNICIHRKNGLKMFLHL